VRRLALHGLARYDALSDSESALRRSLRQRKRRRYHLFDTLSMQRRNYLACCKTLARLAFGIEPFACMLALA
jgi:hypothetical protein